MAGPRPYRSRKIPACVRCRRRRSKCTVEAIGTPCQLCQRSGVQCSAVVTAHAWSNIRRYTPSAPRTHDREQLESTDVQIVPPLVARDTQVLEEFLPSEVVATPSTNSTRTPHKPIYHVSIPPRRPSLERCSCSQDLSLQLISRVRPFFDRICELYLAHLHPCLPIFDRALLETLQESKTKTSQTLLLSFEAYSIFYWNIWPDLKSDDKPDQDFAWQVACASLNDDMQSSSLFSIISIILNIAGRPSKGTIHNLTSVARIVALSHSIGLNHDCSGWQISGAEKRMRCRVWWAVLVHDRFFHFAQGTPPLISSAHHDVPLPSIALLVQPHVQDGRELHSAQCYIAFCRLTEIVGDILPLIYHVRSGTMASTSELVTSSHRDLDVWVTDLPAPLSATELTTRPRVPGLVNLQMAYLSVRMLLYRLTWHEYIQMAGPYDEAMLDQCHQAADYIVVFLRSLQSHELNGFWLPYHAQHFTSATTLLLRCALQTQSARTRSQCVDGARQLVDCLRSYHAQFDWDLAELALSQSAKVLQRFEDALPKLNERQHDVRSCHDSTGLQNHDEFFAEPANVDAEMSQWFDPLHQFSLEELFPSVFSAPGDVTVFD